MLQWLGQWWRKRQRSVDMRCLWPVLKQNAPNLAWARAAFYIHATNDNAWSDYDRDELIAFVDTLQ